MKILHNFPSIHKPFAFTFTPSTYGTSKVQTPLFVAFFSPAALTAPSPRKTTTSKPKTNNNFSLFAITHAF